MCYKCKSLSMNSSLEKVQPSRNFWNQKNSIRSPNWILQKLVKNSWNSKLQKKQTICRGLFCITGFVVSGSRSFEVYITSFEFRSQSFKVKFSHFGIQIISKFTSKYFEQSSWLQQILLNHQYLFVINRKLYVVN